MLRGRPLKAWLRRIVPRPLRKLRWALLTRWRYWRFLRWLRYRRPGIYERLAEPELSEPVRQYVLGRLALEPYHRLGASPRDPIVTDILLVEHVASVEGIKNIIALKRVAPSLHCTLLVRSLYRQEALARRYFDRVELHHSGVELINWLLTTRARALVLRGNAEVEGTLSRLFFDGRLINRTSDLRWGFPDFDLKGVRALAEKFQWEHADGIFHIHSDAASRFLSRYVNTRCPIVTIRPQCVPELGPSSRLRRLSEDDGELHLAAVNAPAARRGGRPIKGQWDAAADLLDTWSLIAAQRLHVHFYIPYPSAAAFEAYQDYFELAKNSSYFHIEQSMPFDDLLVDLTKYDWGLDYVDYRGVSAPPELEEQGPNNLFTYIQAGLPLICSTTMPLPVRIIEQYGNGLVVDEKERLNLRARLQGVSREELENAARRAQEELVFDHQAFYDLVLGPSRERRGVEVG